MVMKTIKLMVVQMSMGEEVALMTMVILLILTTKQEAPERRSADGAINGISSIERWHLANIVRSERKILKRVNKCITFLFGSSPELSET